MDAEYRSGQPADHWPRRGRWNPDELPGWYREMLGELAGKLTTWREDDRDPHRLDPRCDPRPQPHPPRQERRHANG
jgi:hypothetical protein